MSRERHLRRSYGLTIGQYQQMLDEQQSLCYVCKKLPVPTKKSILIEIVAFTESRPVAFPTMLTVLFFLRDRFRARAVLQAEILALRHQLLVLQRASRTRRLRLRWLTVSCGSGFRDWGTIGVRHCSWSSPRRSSPGIARGFDCIGIGRVVAIVKDDRV